MSISLNTKVYNVVGFNQNGQFVYSETSSGVPSSFSYLTAKASAGTGKSGSTVKWNLSIPVAALTDSDCACAGDVLRAYYTKFDVTIPPGSSAAERADLYLRIKDLVASPQFKASIEGIAQPST